MRWRWIALICLGTASARAALLDDIGLTALRARTGALIADGHGIPVAQVEAPDDGAYAPDLSASAFAGKTFSLVGIVQDPPSPHATGVGDWLYGSAGVAPAVSSVRLFSNDSFLGSAGLRVGMPAVPAKPGALVVNNSWIGDAGTATWNSDALRRLDYVAVRDNVFFADALDNATSDVLPILMAAGFNGLAVGVHPAAGAAAPSTAFTIDGARLLPDITVPAATTSVATAVVSGSAALLMSEARARRKPVSALATRAMLLAGAEQGPDWHHGAASPRDDIAEPLDFSLGAGSLRVDRAFDILGIGELAPGNAPRTRGWAIDKARRRRRVDYNIALTRQASHFTAALVWNRRIPNANVPFSSRTPILAQMQLTLLMKRGSAWVPISRSFSRDDNLDFIVRNRLAPGRYRLSVVSDRDETFSIAWLTDFAEPALPLPAELAAAPGVMLPLEAAQGAVTVPEPSSLAWLGAAVLLLVGRPPRPSTVRRG